MTDELEEAWAASLANVLTLVGVIGLAWVPVGLEAVERLLGCGLRGADWSAWSIGLRLLRSTR
jgi:hypothetical protein